MLRSILLASAVLFALGQNAATAFAQTFPTRTVKFILPFGPGSGADTTMRLLADRLSARWGKPVVIENRPGGDGFIAINAFISANDEHTFLYTPVALFAVHPYTNEKLSYNANRDLLPVASVTALTLSLAVPASLKVGSLREFIELVRSAPGKYNAAAAPGNTEFLISGFLKSMDMNMAKVPYRDIMQAPRDLAEGRVHLLMSSLVIVQPLMAAGKVNVLAVNSGARAPSAPTVPTVKEAGYPELELESIQGIFGSRSMSKEMRAQVAADIKAVADSDPSIKTKLGATGQTLNVRGPDEFAAEIKVLREKLAGIAKILGIKAAQ